MFSIADHDSCQVVGKEFAAQPAASLSDSPIDQKRLSLCSYDIFFVLVRTKTILKYRTMAPVKQTTPPDQSCCRKDAAKPTWKWHLFQFSMSCCKNMDQIHSITSAKFRKPGLQDVQGGVQANARNIVFITAIWPFMHSCSHPGLPALERAGMGAPTASLTSKPGKRRGQEGDPHFLKAARMVMNTFGMRAP
eukprot:4098755-Amphidinium_carterae.1